MQKGKTRLISFSLDKISLKWIKDIVDNLKLETSEGKILYNIITDNNLLNRFVAQEITSISDKWNYMKPRHVCTTVQQQCQPSSVKYKLKFV